LPLEHWLIEEEFHRQLVLIARVVGLSLHIRGRRDTDRVPGEGRAYRSALMAAIRMMAAVRILPSRIAVALSGPDPGRCGHEAVRELIFLEHRQRGGPALRT
jgi:hypothetical protein